VAGVELRELQVAGHEAGWCEEVGNMVVEGGGIVLDVVSLDSSRTR